MDIVKEHREKCTYCGKCLEVCPRYDDLRLIEDLYRYLEGSLDIDSDSLLRCLTCGLCTGTCPQGLGIKPLISPARQKWVNENGLTDGKPWWTLMLKIIYSKKLLKWTRSLFIKKVQVLWSISRAAQGPASIPAWQKLR